MGAHRDAGGEQARVWLSPRREPREVTSPRRLLGHTLLALALTTASLAWIVHETGPLESLFRQVRPGWLLAAALALIASWAVRSLRVWLLVRTLGQRASFFGIFTDFVASLFVSGVTPTASGGFPFFVYAMGRRGVEWGVALAANLFDTVLNVLTVAMLGALAWALLIGYAPAGGTASILLVGVGIWVVMGGLLAVTTLLAPRFAARGLYRLSQRLKREDRRPSLTRLVRALAAQVAQHTRAIRRLRRRGRAPVVVNLVLNLIYWAAYLSVGPLILTALGLAVDAGPGAPLWLDAVFAHLNFHLVQNLIPTPGAAGGAEWGLAYLFRPYLSADRLGGFVVLWRLITYYFQVAVGGLFLPRTLRQMVRGPS